MMKVDISDVTLLLHHLAKARNVIRIPHTDIETVIASKLCQKGTTHSHATCEHSYMQTCISFIWALLKPFRSEPRTQSVQCAHTTHCELCLALSQNPGHTAYHEVRIK